MNSRLSKQGDRKKLFGLCHHWSSRVAEKKNGTFNYHSGISWIFSPLKMFTPGSSADLVDAETLLSFIFL